MSTYGKIAEEASRLLNDSTDNCGSEYNFTRWSKRELISYAKDAVAVIASSVPKKFVAIKTVKLQKGFAQELPKNCSKIIKFLGLVGDANASLVSPTNINLSSLFREECYSNSSNYVINSFSVESVSDKVFYVDPPVPASEEGVEAKVLCYHFPDESLDDDYVIESWMHNIIIEWVLYRGYSSEDESTTSGQNTTVHLQHFYTLISNYRSSMDSLEDDARKAVNETSGSNR
jgi:hypothetical protein